jgi:6-phosphogluconolactonase
MAYDSAGARLFVGTRSGGDNALQTIALDGAGVPSLVGSTPLSGSPVYIASYAGGSRLVTGYFGEDMIRLHDASGVPPYAQTDERATPEEPHATFVHEGRVYVPHRAGGVITWNDLSDVGTFGEGGAVDGGPGAGPRHIDFHPSGEFAYVVNEMGDSVSAYRVVDGALSPMSTETTLPLGVDGAGNSCADIHVHPGGGTLYASNRGHDSIAILDIEADGSLTFREAVPTEETPREFELTPSGHLLIAFGQASGAAQSYVVTDDGSLRSADRLPLGADLLWGIFLPDE